MGWQRTRKTVLMTERNTTKFKYIQIPREIYYSKDLSPTEKMLWGRIDSLSRGRNDGCTASNEWLSNDLDVTPRYVSETISKLAKLGYLKSELSPHPERGVQRNVWTKPQELLFVGGRSLRDTVKLQKPIDPPTPFGVDGPPSPVPLSNAPKEHSRENNSKETQYENTHLNASAGEKSLQSGGGHPLTDLPAKGTVHADGSYTGPPSQEAFEALQKLRAAAGLLPRDREFAMAAGVITPSGENVSIDVDAVVVGLAKEKKSNPHTYGYENQKTIQSHYRKANLHKAILTGEVSLAELKPKRKTKKETK
jgi:hypothetical protein